MTSKPQTAGSTRTALVTGAIGGIGRAMVQRLASDGFRLVLTDVRSCDAFIRDSGVASQIAYHAACDLESEVAVAAFLQQTLARTEVDVLIVWPVKTTDGRQS